MICGWLARTMATFYYERNLSYLTFQTMTGGTDRRLKHAANVPVRTETLDSVAVWYES